MRAIRQSKVGVTLITGVILIFLFTLGTTQSFATDERYLKINRSIELFGRVFHEIINGYVDEIDPEYFMRAGIEGMLNALDPYTTYIDETRRDEVNLLTTGRYGGVGISIGMRDSRVTVVSVMEGYAAAKQGIMTGDRISAIDGEPVSSLALSEIRSRVRGEPGSVVEFTIEREGVDELLTFFVIRESIRVQNLSYAGFVDNGIVYLRLERFSRGAGGETRNALRELSREGDIKGIILDLRNNSGGLLDAAVEVADIFIPRSELIVSTKGRTPNSIRQYTATQEPLFKDTPLVVLINERSASASEIVAGAIQDHDRGIIVGVRSFGKGLVQTVANLTSSAQLKLTTSRYYTPSGRTIQAFDYVANAPKGLFPGHLDSLEQEYYTTGGRRVFAGQGIDPDTLVYLYEPSKFMEELNRRAAIFLFATHFVHTKGRGQDDFVVDDKIVNQFKQFLKDKDFRYEEKSELKVRELREIAATENFSGEILDLISQLENYIGNEKERAFERHWDEIHRELSIEIARRYRGEEGKIETELQYDKQFAVAMDFLKDRALYRLQFTTVD